MVNPARGASYWCTHHLHHDHHHHHHHHDRHHRISRRGEVISLPICSLLPPPAPLLLLALNYKGMSRTDIITSSTTRRIGLLLLPLSNHITTIRTTTTKPDRSNLLSLSATRMRIIRFWREMCCCFWLFSVFFKKLRFRLNLTVNEWLIWPAIAWF